MPVPTKGVFALSLPAGFQWLVFAWDDGHVTGGLSFPFDRLDFGIRADRLLKSE